MPNYSDTTLNQLIINQLTKSQYEQIVPDPNQLYFVDDGEDYVKDVQVDGTSVVNNDGIAEIPKEIFPVNVTLTSLTAGTADKNSAQIGQAVANGLTPIVFLQYDELYLCATLAVADELAVFEYLQPGIVGNFPNCARLSINLYRNVDIIWTNLITAVTVNGNSVVSNDTAAITAVTDVTVDNTSIVDSLGVANFSQATAITALSTATVAVPNSITTTSSGTAITALSTATFTPKTGVSSTSASAITALSTGTFTPKTGISVTGSATAITSLATDSFTPKTGISVTASIDAITALNSASITPVTGNTVLNSASYASGVLTLGSGNAVTTGTAVYFATPTPKTTASALQTVALTNGTAINYVTGASTTDTFVKSVSLTDGTAITYVNGASTTDTFLKTITLTNGTAITYVSAVSATDTFLKTVSLATSNITYVSGASSTKSFITKS